MCAAAFVYKRISAKRQALPYNVHDTQAVTGGAKVADNQPISIKVT
jgi:hypothetical protein